MNTTQAKAAIENILTTEKRRELEEKLMAGLAADFDKATKSSPELGAVTVPPRAPIIGSWFKQGDLGFICGARGLGKTWLAMLMARKIAEGVTFGGIPEWTTHGPRRVLYVDGEMPMDGIRERDAALSAAATSGMFYLQHEALFHLTGRALNLAEPSSQATLLRKCLRDKIEVLFLDNLSCLFSGMRENDADAWERVLPWLLELRRNRIAVIFIAHSGRNGFMRGTSRREDAAFWIINLSEAKASGEVHHAARFLARFLKSRNVSETECPALEWTFYKPPGMVKAQVSWKKTSTAQLFRQCVEEGLTSASDIAEEIGVSRALISRLATRAVKEGWLEKDGRLYALKSSQAQ